MEYNLYNKPINNLKPSSLLKHSNAEFILYKDTFNSVNTSTARLVYVIDNNVSNDKNTTVAPKMKKVQYSSYPNCTIFFLTNFSQLYVIVVKVKYRN